jgi:hypothetical protein
VYRHDPATRDLTAPAQQLQVPPPDVTVQDLDLSGEYEPKVEMPAAAKKPPTRGGERRP